MTFLTSPTLAQQKMRISSANIRWVIAGAFLPILTPFSFPSASQLRSIRDRSSGKMMNRNGEKGSPCLRPLSIGIWPKMPPLSSNSTDAEEMQFKINLTNLSEKPKSVRMLERTTQSTLWYAFCMSTLIPTIPFKPLLCLIECTILFAKIEFSLIYLPRTKVVGLEI